MEREAEPARRTSLPPGPPNNRSDSAEPLAGWPCPRGRSSCPPGGWRQNAWHQRRKTLPGGRSGCGSPCGLVIRPVRTFCTSRRYLQRDRHHMTLRSATWPAPRGVIQVANLHSASRRQRPGHSDEHPVAVETPSRWRGGPLNQEFLSRHRLQPSSGRQRPGHTHLLSQSEQRGLMPADEAFFDTRPERHAPVAAAAPRVPLDEAVLTKRSPRSRDRIHAGELELQGASAPWDTITGRAEVLEVRADKAVTPRLAIDSYSPGWRDIRSAMAGYSWDGRR